MKHVVVSSLIIWIAFAVTDVITAADWARFRGPDGLGISSDTKVPVTWNESDNLKWKTELPGPGSSSPIIVGKRVLVTCYSGYGVDRSDPGEMEDLKRHLICIDRDTGKTLWSQAVPAELPEDPYRGFIAEHGYASHTPVSDGERVFAFFGKSGVLAFDMEGKKLWQTNVGKESGTQRWGSAASPILHKNLVIVNASEENEAIVALDKNSGEQVWKAQAAGLSGNWGTPVLVDVEDQTELVIAVPYEIWALNADTGKLKWYAEGIDSTSICASLVHANGIVYAVGGRSGGAVAVRCGGKGDVTDSHVVWRARTQGRVCTPILHEGRLYWVNRGIANCLNAETGEKVYQDRVEGWSTSGRTGGFGGLGGMMGGSDYASPILVDGKIYCTRRSGDVFVLAAKPEFQQLARNSAPAGGGDFSATPAVGDGQLLIRSNRFLYCIAAK
jgi:outer membrane protein assembly factor BamB